MNPKNLFKIKSGTLNISDIDIGTIVKKTGSPLYIYDAAIMHSQMKKLKSAMPKEVTIHYAVKANPNMAVAEVFQKLGAGAEVASGSELTLAIKAGFKPEKIIFAGPGKSEQELKLAIKNKIGSINVESETELLRVLKASTAKRPTPIALRVNLDFALKKGEIMIGGPRKFGIDETQIKSLAKKALNDSCVELTGFHCFPGTQLANAKTLATAYRQFAAWVKITATNLKMNVKTINFGGGLGIPFKDSDAELNVKALGKSLNTIINDLRLSPLFSKTRFLIEPGRYLVGPSGIYISRITDIKKSRGETFVICEGGIHHALVPIVLNKNYPTAILNKMNLQNSKTVTIAGPLCTSADQFSRRVKLPQAEIGDLLGVFNSGAYGYTAGMTLFLSHPTPPEALVENGNLYIIRKPKKPEHGTRSRIKL
ncbi:Diaminopimelate decarboxylase [hydrothermal vent metagenome]|uniref:Diaminopimelate decarboxylase n=1 Tax=hydrothermal vent metagenome TaxID=652676 RepID=A0A3B1BYE7_9ZZZZ